MPGAILGAVCLLIPEMRLLLGSALQGFFQQPVLYAALGIVLLTVLNVYAWFIDKRWSIAQFGWIVYLGAVSAWEEWVFRLALPYYLESQGGSLGIAVIAANLVFAAAHFFTLRWKWQWCVLAFIFGMGLSRNLSVHYDLALVIGIHWLATFLNTPRSPGGRSVV